MKPIYKIIIITITLAVFLGLNRVFIIESVAAESIQLSGEAAREFLAQEGILPLLAANWGMAPPQWRNFGEPPPTTATDGLANDEFGVSVAVDDATVVVGASQVDFNGNINQGAVYIFIRDGLTWTQQQKLVAADGTGGDSFGSSVAVVGNTLIVGAPKATVNVNLEQGAAYVFTRSGATWSEQDKLTSGDGMAEDNFGFSVAIMMDTAVIGAPGVDIGGEAGLGAAYVFTRNGSSWSEQDRVEAGDGAANDGFGWDVGIEGETLVIGAPDADVNGLNRGAAYVFTRSGAIWNEQDKLTAGDGELDDAFGTAVALHGESVVVGSPLASVVANDQQGAAYVFFRSGSTWSEQQKLVGSGGMMGDQFGTSVALDGETIVIGAHLADVNGNLNQGTAYIFTRLDTTWSEHQILLAADGAGDNSFGTSVALAGDTLVIGADGADVNGENHAGKTYLAERGPVPWEQLSNNVANDGTEGDEFGYSVAIDGDTAVVGAHMKDVGANGNQGVAYIFIRNGLLWLQQDKLIAEDGEESDQFGKSVAVDGDTVVIGAPLADVSGRPDQGAAYVFTRNGSNWTHQQKLVSLDGTFGDQFGVSVALSGDSVIIGADKVDYLGAFAPDQGAAYVFIRSGLIWSQQQKLLAGDGAEDDRFGNSVAINGDNALIGAYLADVDTEEDQGAAYVFTRNGTTWTEQDKLVAIDGGANDNLGISVALEEDTAVVGADRDNIAGVEDQGSAYIFKRNGVVWDETQKLQASDGTEFDEFGQSVTISGDLIVIGAVADDASGIVNRGTAYVFSRSSQLWHQEQKLLAEDGEAGDFFGFSVAVSGETTIIGSFLADVDSNDSQGRINFFNRQPVFEIYLPLTMME